MIVLALLFVCFLSRLDFAVAVLCRNGECDLRKVSCGELPQGFCAEQVAGPRRKYVADADSARRICESLNMALVAPADKATNDAMFALCPGAAFFDIVGVLNSTTRCVEFFVASTSVPDKQPFFNWGLGQPNNAEDDCPADSVAEPCISFYGSGFRMDAQWFDRSCNNYSLIVDRQLQNWQLFAPECIICGQIKATTLAPTPSTTTATTFALRTTITPTPTPTTTAQSNDSIVSEESSGSGDGALIGGVIAGVLLVLICCIIVALALFSVYGRKRTAKKDVATAAVVRVAPSVGNYGSVGAAQDHYSQMTMSMPNTEPEPPSEQQLEGQYGAAPKFKTDSMLGTTQVVPTDAPSLHYGLPPQRQVVHYEENISPLQV